MLDHLLDVLFKLMHLILLFRCSDELFSVFVKYFAQVFIYGLMADCCHCSSICGADGRDRCVRVALYASRPRPRNVGVDR